MTADKSTRIDEELVCIESLAHFLEERGIQEIQIQREPDDPPDFWISISGEQFAAEVTSIVADHDYDALCSKLKDTIRSSCESDSCLNGKYVLLVMDRPEIPKRTSRQWEELVLAATSYIRTTVSDQMADRIYLIQDSNGYLAVEKVSDQGATVGLAGPFSAKWEGEARSQLLDLLQAAVDMKRKVLEKKRVLEVCPNIILLFYDAYGFCDIQDATEAFQDARGYDFFHSVYWAASFADRQNLLFPGNPGRKGCFLYSKVAEWTT